MPSKPTPTLVHFADANKGKQLVSNAVTTTDIDHTRKSDRATRKTWILCSIVAGSTMFVIGCVFHLLVPIIIPDLPEQYLHDELFRPWHGWTSTYMALHPFGYGFVFAGVYLLLRRRLSFARTVRDGLLFGSGVFIVGALPVYLLVFASFQVTADIITSWTLQSLVQYTVSGIAVGAVDAHEERKTNRLS